MNVEEKVQEILIANAALTARVPAPRIKCPGDWQALATPYIIHVPVAIRTIHTYNEGLMPLRTWEVYEVSVYALAHQDARQIGDLVVNALDGYLDPLVSRIAYLETPAVAGFDTDRKLATVTLDFEISGELT